MYRRVMGSNVVLRSHLALYYVLLQPRLKFINQLKKKTTYVKSLPQDHREQWYPSIEFYAIINYGQKR